MKDNIQQNKAKEYTPIVSPNTPESDEPAHPITVEIVNAFLKYQKDIAISGHNYELCLESIKYGFSIAVGAANTILFNEVTNAFAKDYLKLNLYGQKIFSFSSCYANFFLSVYTSVKLIELYIDTRMTDKILKQLPSIKPKANNKQTIRLIIITGTSFITSIPTMAPLSDSTEQLLTLFSNMLMYMYALYEFQMLQETDENISLYFDNIRAGIVLDGALSDVEIIKNSGQELLDFYENYKKPISKTKSLEISKIAYFYAVLSAISVVTPFFLAMTASMNDPNADNGFLNYLVVKDKSIRLFVAITTSFVTEAVFFVLSAYFGYKTVYDFYDMFNGTTRLTKQHYPNTWWTLKAAQTLIASLSWSTGVKLFLDFFGGPNFSGYNNLEMLGIYAGSILIAIGLFSFNVYSNIQLVDVYMEKGISLFGTNNSKSQLELINITNKLEFITQYATKYYRPKLKTSIESTFSENQHHTIWSTNTSEPSINTAIETDDEKQLKQSAF